MPPSCRMYCTIPKVMSFPSLGRTDTQTKSFNHPSGGLCHSSSHLLRLAARAKSQPPRLAQTSKGEAIQYSRVSVGDPVTVWLGDTVSDTVGSTLETLNRWLLLVGVNVELDEQEQVTGQDTASKQGGRLSASAVPNVRPGQAPRSETRIS